ncbi:MAG: phosphatase PAP2 family protein [Acidimicrobiales bacterium]
MLRGLATLLGVAGVIFVIGLGLGLLFVGRHGGGAIQGWDNQVQAWDIHHRFGLVGISKVVAFIGDAPNLAVVAAAITVILLLTIRTIRSFLPLVAYFGGEFQVFLIREIIHRPRPPTAVYPAPGAIPGIHDTSFSYPSGHSVAVTAILFALLGTVALTYRKWWPWVVAALVSLFVIDTRLVLGVHWFSDVAFGLLLGIGWGVTVAIVGRTVEWDDVKTLLPASMGASGSHTRGQGGPQEGNSAR